MKRLVCVMLLVAMLLGCTYAVADDDKGMMDYTMEYAKGMMSALVDIYEANPSAFDEDYIFLLHANFELYNAAETARNAENWVQMKSIYGGTFFNDFGRDSESLGKSIYEAEDEMYYKWVDKVITNERYAEFLVGQVKVILMTEEELMDYLGK